MPFKSQAQREKFRELVKQGKLSQAEFDKWEVETGDSKLPDRLTPKEPKKKKARF